MALSDGRRSWAAPEIWFRSVRTRFLRHSEAASARFGVDARDILVEVALPSSPSALPTLMAFAAPGQVLFGSDLPFAPTPAGQYSAVGLDTSTVLDAASRDSVNVGNAEALFPQFGQGAPPGASHLTRIRDAVQHAAADVVVRLVQPR